jgi:hypothetical protein
MFSNWYVEENFSQVPGRPLFFEADVHNGRKSRDQESAFGHKRTG